MRRSLNELYKSIHGIFINNFINLFINQFTNLFVGFWVTRIMFSRLGEETFGLVNLALSVVMLLSISVSYGYHLNGPKHITLSENQIQKTQRVINQILATRLIISALIAILIFLVSQFLSVSNSFQIILYFSLIILLSEALFPIFYFQGKDQLSNLSIANFFAKVSYLALVYFFVKGPENAPWMNFFFGITSLSVYVVLWISIYRKEKIQFDWVKWSEILFRIKENFHYFLSSIGGHIHIHGGLIILGFFAGNSVLGKYALAQKIAFLLRMIPVFFTQAILQKAVKHQAKTTNTSSKEINHLYYIGLSLTLLMGILVALFAKWIIYIQGGRFVSYSSGILQVLAFIPFLSMLNFRNMITILVEEKQVILNKATWFTAIFMVITSCFTCYFYGGYGLAFALIATEIVSYFSHSILLIQHGIKTS